MKHSSTILIVDDLPSIREVLRGLLTGQGYNLALAGSGAEALAKAAELMPDVILLDVMMPEMDGFEVCQRLRADPLLAEVPIIMITALDDHHSLLQGIEAGADDFISKPFNHAELQTRVRTVTRLNRYRRLLAARRKFDWVVEQANDGYLVVDKSDCILYANPRAGLYLELPAGETIELQTTFLEIARQHYYCQPEQAWLTWPQQTSPVRQLPRYLVRPESDTAQALWLQVSTLELPLGSEEGWIVHLRDVSLQMALQRDMWEFQAMVAHKLRTPTTSIFSGLQLLNEQMSNNWDAKAASLFEIVFRGTKRLYTAVEDILEYLHTPDLAQPGLGFNLVQLQPLAARLGAELGLASVMVAADRALDQACLALQPQAVELILREILENAKKFHPHQNPTVEILVSGGPDRQRVAIQIKDDGQNLSPEQLVQVWTPYYQGDKYFTGEVAGMGLGLSRVALLIWGVGGACGLYNRAEGAGVVVELTLPLSKCDEQTGG